MSGHRDDGTVAEDKAHHEGRKVDFSNFYPHMTRLLSRLYGISEDQAHSIIDRHQNKGQIGDSPDFYDDRLMRHIGTSGIPADTLAEAFAYRHLPDGALDNSNQTPTYNGVGHPF